MEPITWSWMEIVFAFILWWGAGRMYEKSSTETRPKKKKRNETKTPTVGLACLALSE